MITKILSKINIHYSVYIIGILSIITGLFKSFIMMYFIVIIHEIGHNVFLYLFNYKIKSINIYPFGGYTKINNKNDTYIKEFLIFFGGILFQLILLLIFNILLDKNTYIYKLFTNYNTTIILFNLIPVIPLDGSKLINIVLNIHIPYKYSHKITIYISYIIILILLLIYNKDLNMLLITILFISLVIKEHINHIYIFNNFLITRYLNNIKYKKNNYIRGINYKLMMKYKNNIFITNKEIHEKDILYKNK